MKRRDLNYKQAQDVCRHCKEPFVYFKVTKSRIYCTQTCATKAGNLYFNGLVSAARRQAREHA